MAAASSGTPSSGDFPFPREYRGVYLDRRRESGFQLYNTLGIVKGDKAAYAKQALENFNFFGAPHVAIITTDEALGVYGAIDCGGYVTNFMTGGAGARRRHRAAGGAGVSFRGGAQAFRHGDDRRVVCGISFGFPDTRAQDQQLSHQPRRTARGRDVRGVIPRFRVPDRSGARRGTRKRSSFRGASACERARNRILRSGGVAGTAVDQCGQGLCDSGFARRCAARAPE